MTFPENIWVCSLQGPLGLVETLHRAVLGDRQARPEAWPRSALLVDISHTERTTRRRGSDIALSLC